MARKGWCGGFQRIVVQGVWELVDRSSSAKKKGPASAATSNTSPTVAEADLKRATAHIEHFKDQLKQLGATLLKSADPDGNRSLTTRFLWGGHSNEP